jgi:hypothetical protein
MPRADEIIAQRLAAQTDLDLCARWKLPPVATLVAATPSSSAGPTGTSLSVLRTHLVLAQYHLDLEPVAVANASAAIQAAIRVWPTTPVQYVKAGVVSTEVAVLLRCLEQWPHRAASTHRIDTTEWVPRLDQIMRSVRRAMARAQATVGGTATALDGAHATATVVTPTEAVVRLRAVVQRLQAGS